MLRYSIEDKQPISYMLGELAVCSVISLKWNGVLK